jgi:cell division protein FtsB
LAGALVASVLCVGVLLIAVFPTRSYLAQRASIHKAERRLSSLDRENQRLATQARRLSTPDEIERLARGQYGLVRPGEQAYAILPAPKPPIGLPELWPFAGLEHLLRTG